MEKACASTASEWRSCGTPSEWETDFRGIAGVDANTAWVVGDGGIILKTTDGGAGWSPQNSGTVADLYDIDALDANTAWAVGGSGTILKTTDGGASWSNQSPGTYCDLRAVCAVDANVAWAAGYTGSWQSGSSAILRTTDGGAYWWLHWQGYNYALYDISAVDANTAWASGAFTRQVGNPAFPQYETKGVIMKTASGGLLWFHQFEGVFSNSIFETIDAVDANTVWAAGFAVYGLKTSDGGATWVPKSAKTYVVSLAALSDTEVWACSEGTIWHTVDDGASWTQFAPDTYVSLREMEAINSSIVWAVGSNKLLKTINGGGEWTTLDVGVRNAFMGVAMADVYHAWMVGMDIGFCNIHIIGAEPYYIRQTYQMWDVTAADASTVWACGSNGTIAKTADGGIGWALQNFGTASALLGIAAADAQTVWCVGSGGAILKTQNGGASWGAQASGTTAWLWDVSAVDGTTAWAVGSDGAILKTQNGGASWGAQASGAAGTLLGVSAVDTTTAWAVGVDGIILKTSDGGATWTAQDSGTSQWLWGVAAVDADTAWTVGHNGTILKTEDGGATWEQETSGTTAHLYDVAAVDGDTARAVGMGGVNLWTADWDRWVSQDAGLPYNSIMDMDAVDATTAWAVGESGEVLRSTDGETWSATAGTDMVGISALDSQTAWAWQSWGNVYSTDDGGVTWTAHPGEAIDNHVVRDICCVDPDTVWAASASGIHRTLDGGLTWELLDHGTVASQAYAVAALDADNIWFLVIISLNDLGDFDWGVLRTTDGGATWSLTVLQRIDPADPYRGYTDLFMADAATAWAVGYDGTIQRTTDGGLSWSRQDSGTAKTLYGVDGDGSAVWAVGARRTILRTTDGGNDWGLQYVDLDSYIDLWTVAAADANTAWAGGLQSGTIVKTADWEGEAPFIISMSPQAGQTGDEVAIEGSGFGAYRGSSDVVFACAKSGTYTSWSDGHIACAVPQGASGEVEVRVARSGLVSNGVPFTATATYPTLSSINPTQGRQGSTVSADLVGSGLQSGVSVRLERGATVIPALNATVVSDTQITCTLGIGIVEAGAYDVVVRNPDGQEARLVGGFTVTSICGQGASASMLALGLTLGLLSLAGSAGLRRKRKRR